jgi:hypothetical protein
MSQSVSQGERGKETGHEKGSQSARVLVGKRKGAKETVFADEHEMFGNRRINVHLPYTQIRVRLSTGPACSSP